MTDAAEAWAEARDLAALALDALEGPETPEAREEALRYANAIIHALTFPAWKASWSHHMANLPTAGEYFAEVLGEGGADA